MEGATWRRAGHEELGAGTSKGQISSPSPFPLQVRGCGPHCPPKHGLPLLAGPTWGPLKSIPLYLSAPREPQSSWLPVLGLVTYHLAE